MSEINTNIGPNSWISKRRNHHHHCHHWDMCSCGYCFDCGKYVYYSARPWGQPYRPYGPFWNSGSLSGSAGSTTFNSCNH